MGQSVPLTAIHLGAVTAFDPKRGWGTVSEERGDAFEFHATAIADGSRTIALGAEVSFLVQPGHRGRYEARNLTVAGLTPSPRSG
jgi:cold shock CspA family protein